MMAENPNYWWSLNGKPPPPSLQPSATFLSSSPPRRPPPLAAAPPPSLFHPQFLFGSSSPLLPPNSLADHDPNQDFPLSWSQLLLGGLASEEEQILNQSLRMSRPPVEVKQEFDQNRQLIYSSRGRDEDDDDDGDDGLQACSSSWSSQVNPLPSAGSCVSSNILDFSSNNRSGRNQLTEHSSQCNGTSTGGASKKPRVQASSSQPPLKVRKEKLGDRITALHQLVSPFGKTDTASVLLEATTHIRFLEGQIQALSSPYLNLSNVSGSMRHQQSRKLVIRLKENQGAAV